MTKKDEKFEKQLSSKLFEVEHALGLYANSIYSLPAEAIYNDDLDEKFGEGTRNCHIYLIGIVPKIDLKGARHEGDSLHIDFEVKGTPYTVSVPMPEGLKLEYEGDSWYLSDGSDGRYGPSDEQIFQAFQMQHGLLEFHVVYVGQAYGKDGSRHALDRLKKHETLQKIALGGAPEGYVLQLILIEIHPSSQLFTFLNPFASDNSHGEQRISQGVDKLFGTNEHERITLYEASLIRYFRPKYNKEFKDSFPSTHLKVLADCYDKDFSSIVSEICFDTPPFLLCSECIPPKREHIIQFDLHEEENRKGFFSQG